MANPTDRKGFLELLSSMEETRVSQGLHPGVGFTRAFFQKLRSGIEESGTLYQQEVFYALQATPKYTDLRRLVIDLATQHLPRRSS